MSYYDEEPMYEPMPEFLEQINVLVTEQVKSGRAEMVEQLENVKKHNESLMNKNYELSRQVSNMSSEIKKQVDAARKEFEREMFRGFLVGENFFYASFGYQHDNCETCKGVGYLSATLENGTTANVACPSSGCSKGKISKGVYTVRESVITGMFMRKGKYNSDSYIKYNYRGVHGGENDIGAVECFKTVEEAQVRCDKKTEEYQSNKR